LSPFRQLQIKGLSRIPVPLAQVLDEIPLGVMVLNEDRKVILVNRGLEAVTGFPNPESYGIPCHYILRGNLCGHGCPIKDVAKTGEQFCSEANIINRSRQKIPVRLTVSPLLDNDGNVIAFIESVEDLRSQETSLDDAVQSLLQGRLVGVSGEMQRIFKIIPVIAQTDSSVLITGETGTGKDVVAEAIHHASERAKGPFIKINCGALPEALLESELFGHQKGAFTGAIENKPGRFRLAHSGSVYLTEIGDLPLSLQVKLLSFLDDKVVYPLGSTKGYHVDVRVIAATHRHLEKMVRDGLFREDLLFRLNVIRLHLPPLSKRGDDLRMLLDHFIQTFNARFNKSIKGLSDDAKKVILSYRFPGNVRELRNIVEYSVNVCERNTIHLEHLPAYLRDAAAMLPAEENHVGSVSLPNPPIFSGDRTDIKWSDAERTLLLDAMTRARGRKGEAAKILGCCRSTLWRKLKRHGLVS
jgi:transcriptional regulator with PAS, ATPase and Fis domain